VDTVPAAHMITMTDNDNGINDENALPLPEDNLQGPVDAAARYHLAMSCVRRAIQYRAGSKNSVHYLARGEVHATLAVASASMATSLPTPRPRP